MKKCLLLMLLLLPVTVSDLLAQNQTVTGQITSDDGTTLPGVSVLVKGTTQGSTTDANGKYSIAVPENASLVFSFVGYVTETVEVGAQSVIDVKLVQDVVTLGEIQVTALGIEKSAKSVTYATQQISGEELNKAKDANFINTLTGKSAGVVISRGTSGVGSSSKIVLRGNKSITGNNQPLYVIDGIPMNNAVGSQPSTLYGAYDAGDAISNLNPEDIESINVLKGASAAALYGSQAANGVILITTKKGKKGVARIDLSSTTTFEAPLILPKLQTKYGQAELGVSSDSWGSAVSGSGSRLKDFYQTGANYINSVSITNGNDLGQYYLSYANTRAKGIVPDNNLNKHNISFRGTTKLLKDKLSLDASVNYIRQEIKNRPNGGYYYNPLVGLYLFPMGDDFSKYSGGNFEAFNAARNFSVQNWPYLPTGDGYSIQNPYWVIKRNPNSLLRDRTITSVVAKYEITPWLNIQGRMTYDRTQDQFEQHLYASTDPILTSENGEYTKQTTAANQLYSDVLLSFNKDLSQKVSLSATLGFSNIKNDNTSTRLSTATNVQGDIIKTGLFYANQFSLQNMRGTFSKQESLTPLQTQAAFATASLGLKNQLFVDLTGRNEWSSTVNKTFFYPSIGLSYVLSEALPASDLLTLAKLRASYSEVGNSLPFGVANINPPYGIATDGSITPRNTIPFGELNPERTRSYEAGTDLRFFQNKLNVSFTYYNATTYDQVFTIQAPAGSGTSLYFVNGGKIRNSGIEAVLGYNAQFGELKWQPTFNISRNKNEVLELDDRLETPQVLINTIEQTKIYQLLVKEGGSFGDMYGRVLKRDAQGNVEQDPQTGAPVVAEGQNHFLGNPNPKFLAGFNNQFTYKNVSLSFLIDGRFGGKVVSMTEALLDGKGLSQRSADAREGKLKVGNTEFDSEKYYKTIGGSNPVGSEYVYSATNVRLRELALGYTFSKIGNAVKNLNLSMVGRNLFFIKNEAPFDPETTIGAGNGLQGLDAFNLPATRSYGVSLKASF